MQFTVERVVYGGLGIGQSPHNMAVFVPFVMPGEVVSAKVIKEKPSYARAELLSVDRPHPQRLSPPCPHFGTCGGCHYQHIPYGLQTEFKRQIFIEQLQRLAHINKPFIRAVIPSKLEWGYRNSLQFSLNKQGNLCFADIYTNKLFPVQECYLPMEEVDHIWRLTEFEEGVRVQRVEFRQNQIGNLMMILHGGGKQLPQLASESRLSIVHLDGNDVIVMAGEGSLQMEAFQRQFKVSAASFFQINFSAAEALAKEVVNIIQVEGISHLLDVYCGVGFFSALLAGSLESLTGVESSASACGDFVENMDEFDNVALFQGKAEHILSELPPDYDGILVDPPRSGLKEEVIQSIIRLCPKLLVYVSCNPATLARDAKRLIKGGYRLESSTIVDMFPQTFHIESINVFKR